MKWRKPKPALNTSTKGHIVLLVFKSDEISICDIVEFKKPSNILHILSDLVKSKTFMDLKIIRLRAVDRFTRWSNTTKHKISLGMYANI